MAKYKGRVPSSNIDDIRTGRGSPDDRQEQKYKRNRYLDENYIKNLRNEVAARNAPPLPKPDPRTKMPGGDLALGKGQSRGEFWTKLKEDVWTKQAAQELDTTHYHTKFLGLFPLAPNEYLGGNGSSTWKRQGNEEAAQFLLDTFKRARSVGYPIHPINEQPAPLPMKFKVSQ